MTDTKSKIKRNLSESLKFHMLRLFILSYKFFALVIFIMLIGIISPLVVSQFAGDSFTETALMDQLAADNPPVYADSNDIYNILDMTGTHFTLLPVGFFQGVTFGGMASSMLPSVIETKFIDQWTFGYTTGRVPFTKHGESIAVDMGGFLLGHIAHGIFELPVALFIFAVALMFGNYCYFRFKEVIKKYITFYPNILSFIVYGVVFGMSMMAFANSISAIIGSVLIGITCLLIGQSLEDEYRATSFLDIFKGFLAIAIPCALLLLIAAVIEIMLDWSIIYTYFAEASFFGAVGTYGMTFFWYGVYIYAILWVYRTGKALQTRKV